MRRRLALRLVIAITVAFLAAIVSGPKSESIQTRPPSENRTTSIDVTESTSSIRVSLRLGSLSVRERSFGFGRGHEIRFEHGEQMGVAGAPDLPVIRRWFAVPECDRVEADVTVRSRRRYKSILLRSLDRSEARFSEVRSPASAGREADGWFPSDWARVVKQCHLRGQNMVLVEFSPVRYSSSERTAVVADQIDVNLRPVNARSAVHVHAGPMQELLGLLIANRSNSGHGLASNSRFHVNSDLGTYKWCMSETESDWEATADSVVAFGADYMIIVASELVQHAADSILIESLAGHRASTNSFNVAIVPMQGIDADPDTFLTPVTIRNFIKAVYESETAPHIADGSLAFVLLLGDAFNHPAREILIPGYYGFPTANFDLQGLLKSSDAYYSLLSEDPIIDDLPEVFLGRLPVDHDNDHWELENVVSNILDYEPLPIAAWTDRILMVSGGSTVGFTFDGELGAGFVNFFDSIDAHYIPGNKSVRKMHRLTSGLGNGQFSKAVTDSVKNGFGLFAMFDHGNFFELAGSGGGGCVLPKDYDTLNVQEHPLVLAIGSYLGTFDYTRDKAAQPGATCCTSSSPTATCLQVPLTPLDPCDVLAERMVLQPGGAIGAFGYCRSQSAAIAQGNFVNLFRAMFEENASRLGDVLIATRFLQAWDQVTLKGLTLFGDPAVNILWQEPSPDTLDLAISSSGIRTASETRYVNSNASNTLSIVSQNRGPEAATNVLLEVWEGHPDSIGSILLDSTRVSIAGYGAEGTDVSVGALDVGPHEIYATLDPDGEVGELTRENNTAARLLYAQPNHSGFPVKLKQAAAHSLQMADIHASAGKELLFATYADNLIGTITGAARCYRSSGQELWHTTRGAAPITAPSIASVSKNGDARVYWEAGAYSTSTSRGYLIDPSTGAVADSLSLAGNVLEYLGQTHAVHDLRCNDGSLEVARLNFSAPSPKLVGIDLDGTELWSVTLSIGALDTYYGGLAVGDLDADGSQEVVACAGSSLTVRNAEDGSAVWSASIGSSPSLRVRRVALLDGDGDGRLEVIVNGYSGGQPRLYGYDYDGTSLWARGIEDSAFFAIGDLDNDEEFEIVVASTNKLRILNANGAGIDSTTIASGGRFISPVLLADVTDDDDLEVVVIAHFGGNHYFPDRLNSDLHHLLIFQRDLDPVGIPLEFPAMQDRGSRIADPSIGDLDGNGDAELAFVSRDSVLHVLDIGSGTGEGDWASANANAMRTNLVEQPVGGDYSGVVSLFNRCFVRGDATFDTLYVDMTADVIVDDTDAEATGQDPDRCEVVVRDSLGVMGSPPSRVSFYSREVGNDVWVGLTIDTLATSATLRYCQLSNAQNAFLMKAAQSAVIDNCVIEDCSDYGLSIAHTGFVTVDSTTIRGADYAITARDGTTLSLSNSTIENCSLYGVAVYKNSTLDMTATSFLANGIPVYLAKETGSWIKGTVENCTFSDNDHGVWVSGSGDSIIVIEDCTIENSVSTGMYLENATVSVNDVTMRGAEFGINANPGTKLTLSNSVIEDESLFGILVRDAVIQATSTSFAGNDIGLCLGAGTSWVKATVRDCSFANNGDGVWINDFGDSSIVIDDCLIDDNVTSGIYVEDQGDVTITRSTITNNTIGVYSYDSNPKIRSRNLIQNNAGGIKCDNNSVAVVESCTVNNNTNGVAVLNGANPDLGHVTGGNSLGQNIMRPNTSYHVSNLTSNTIMAENNYWPRNPPSQCSPASTKFYGSVDYDPDLGCTPPDLSVLYEAPLFTSGGPDEDIPARFRLGQNYPNPFNPTTTIAYEVPSPGSYVAITLYDVEGRRVADLVNGHKAPGFYSVSWNARDLNGDPVASGVYFLRMKAGHFLSTKKLVLLK